MTQRFFFIESQISQAGPFCSKIATLMIQVAQKTVKACNRSYIIYAVFMVLKTVSGINAYFRASAANLSSQLQNNQFDREWNFITT